MIMGKRSCLQDATGRVHRRYATKGWITCALREKPGRERFRRMRTLQKFASVHASVHNHFNAERHLVDRQTYKLHRSAALVEWQSLMT